ncbi:hypothetical protein Bbelb_321340 [Branchiostoma belcheri]|nr:hypothetical protein Bbelb_321340 [Branchiostoma belcheri]
MDRLHVFNAIAESVKGPTKKAYKRVTRGTNIPLFGTFELPGHVITTGISPAATTHLSCTKAAPVIDFSVTGHWGGVTLKITDPRIAAGLVGGATAVALALALSRFYRNNRDDVDDIIRRVIERLKRRPRRDGGEPQADPEVVAIEEGSLYVHVGFRTEDGYDFFSALYYQEYIQTRLKAEFKTLGFQGELKVILERSQSFHPATLLTKSESGIETASGYAQSEVSSEDVPDGPLRRRRLRLQPYRDSPTAKRLIQGCRTAENGAELLTGSGYTDPAGLTLLVKGIIMWDLLYSDHCNRFLYHLSYLQLDKKQLNHLTSTQLEHNPADSSCLFLQAALLPEGDSRVARLRQTVNTILQNGEEDPLHPYLHNISCMLAFSIWITTDQPGPALAACATALMYKSDCPVRTLFWTAMCSVDVSASDGIQQFHQYLRAAPPCDEDVSHAHYRLTALYGEQQPVDREKVETHYRSGQEAEKNMLPGISVAGWLKDDAKKAYNRATSTNIDAGYRMKAKITGQYDEGSVEFSRHFGLKCGHSAVFTAHGAAPLTVSHAQDALRLVGVGISQVAQHRKVLSLCSLNIPLFRTFELPGHVITTRISPAATTHLSCTKVRLTQKQAAPVIDFSVTGHWGGVTLKITDSRIAAGVVVGASAVGLALALSRFYRDNRDDVDDIIRRVIERLKRRPRRDGGEPQPDPEVVAIEVGSLYVHVGFRTEDGYDFFSALYYQEYIQTRLKAEFKTLGFQGELKVILERSQSFHPTTTLLTESESGIETASVSAQSGVSSEDVPEGPLRWYRLQLQPYRDSLTAERLIQACRTMERGAELLTSSGYTDPAGLTLLAEGFLMWERLSPEDCNYFLYDAEGLQLDKKRLSHLTSTQLEHSPAGSSCLFLQAALLPYRDSRVERLRQTVDTILQNGEEDPLHPYLHHISCMLADSIWIATDQPGPALAAFATALMYKSDHPPTLYCTAECSMDVSKSDGIQQFHQYLRVAPPCDLFVPPAHYRLTALYSEQQPVDREKVETHYRRGQEAEKNMLPGFGVLEWVKDDAKKAYKIATSTNM